MSGGMKAWRGAVAEGLPEADLGEFFAAATPEEHVAMAWQLEEGTRTFYSELGKRAEEGKAAAVFAELAAAEERHKSTLRAIYEGLAGRGAADDFPAGIPAAEKLRPYMEGGTEVAGAIEWAEGRDLTEVLEVGIAIEANACDRYLILRRELPDENSRRAFEILSGEEKRHLEKMSRLLEQFS